MNEKGEIMFWNKAAEKMFGYSEEEIIGKPVTILIPEEYIERHKKGIRRFLEEPRMLKGTIKVIGLKKNGERFPVEFSFSMYKSDSTFTFIAIARDITEREEMEEELRKSEKLYKSLFEFNRGVLENSPIGIIRLDKDLKIIYENPEMERIMGVPSGEKSKTMGMDIRDIPSIKEAGISTVFNDLLKGKKISGETPFTSIYGKKTYLSFSGVPIFEEEKFEGAVLVINDITERKELEQQFLQAQKMEAIGRLTGGIAHDFNNLLTSIIGYAEMSKMKLSPEESIYNYINQIIKASEQATGLIEKLLAFSRKAITQPKVLNLNSVIKDFKNVLERMLGEDIILEFIPGEGLGNIEIDPHQIEQIVMNLAVNSRDAMPKGGKLVIETKNVELDKSYINKYPYAKAGRYVLLSISDTGCGIDKEILPHIFEPFFTTKKKGEGTGLGLSTVYGIVKQCGGHINVYSEVGKGTTVKVYFPRIDKLANEIISSIKTSELPRGKETVLVVEDEKSIRKLIMRILSQCGYKVLLAKNEKKALSLWDKYGGNIDLLLTDIVLPGPCGKELADKLTSLRPGLKVLYMSGYSDNVIFHHEILEKELNFLQKPFTPQELALKVRKVLDS
jgi:PAS domain S-box-containing protein